MNKRLTKVVALVLAGVLLVGSAGLAGCGEDEGEKGPEIVIGVLTDFTGPACFAVKPTIDAFMDAFKLAEVKGEFGEATIKFITYDQRTDYSRTKPGYIWLKGQGAVMMSIISPTDRSILAEDFGSDEMPVIGSSLEEGSPAHPWAFSGYGSNGHEFEAILQWIMETWDYGTDANPKDPPKIGHQGWVLASTIFYQDGIDRMLDWYPDKFDFVSLEKAPMGTATWAGEIGKLKESDYIFFSTVGSMTSTFIKEARDRGYTGAFISGTNSFPGFWDGVTAVMPADKLYDCYFAGWMPWWDADIDFIDGARESIETYHGGDASRLRSSGPLSGWQMGVFGVDALKRAIEAVGAENVDGPAIRDAFLATNLTVEGFGEAWQFREGYHGLLREMKMFKWNQTGEDWEDTGDPWITPRSLQ